MSQRSHTFALGGGLDVVTPPSQKKAGRLIGGENYEPIDNGGYRRIDGYERFNGLPSPTAASYWIVNFDAGSTTINVADVITGITSTNTAEVLLVVVSSGTFATNDAVGYLVVFNATGLFLDNEALQVSASTVAIANGISTEKSDPDEATHISYMRLAIEARRADIAVVPGEGRILGVWSFNDKVYAFRNNVGSTEAKMHVASATGWIEVATPVLSPNGRYEFVNYNFKGNLGSEAMYGCDGVNKAFQFDGTTLVQITTGMTIDAPEHLAAHKKHLFLSFITSVQFSTIGDPLAWTVLTGAGEIATGRKVIGMDVQPGDVLAIFNQSSTYLLYGSSSADFNLVTHSTTAGAAEWTLQHMNEAIYMDNRGISSLSTTQNFGDFSAGGLSADIETYFRTQKFSAISSVIIREKDQYRLFFNDKSCLLMLKGRRGYQFTAISFPVSVNCTCSIENQNGDEEIYFGSDNGFVYQMEKGNSFDGELIHYSLRLPFISLGQPRAKKRFYKLQIEIDSVDQIPLTLYPDYSYSRVDEPSASSASSDTLLFSRGGYWDTDIVWDDFIWDGQAVGIAEAYLDGNGINISLLIQGDSNYEASHTIYSATYHYNVRGLEY